MEKSVSKFIWHYLRLFKYFILSMIILLSIGLVCRQLIPYGFAKIYETVSTQNIDTAWKSIVLWAGAIGGLYLCSTSFSDLSMFFTSKIIPALRTIVTRDAFDYVNKHSIAYFTQEMSGNISTKVGQLGNGMTELVNQSLNGGWSVAYVLVSFFVFGSINLWFLPFILLWLCSMLFMGLKLGKKRRAMAKEVAHNQSITGGIMVDSLSNYSEVKSFANYHYERFNLLKSLKKLRTSEAKEQKARSLIDFYHHLVIIISEVSFVLLSTLLLKFGQISSTEFIYAVGLFSTMGHVVFAISWSYNHVSRQIGQMHSALETIAVEIDVQDKPHAKELKLKKAEISFENVSFSYKDKRQIFENLNLKIKAGQKIGLVGASGSGKSTFIKLIARYFDVGQGAIKINGVNIADVCQDSLHKNIATIPQDVCLFNRTLYDNIRYGKTGASEKSVFAAAKKAFAAEFIKKFPQGYQTKVGDRGVILSGGERQRIAIARAILKNAPILVFDEATSALDSNSEKHIQKSLTTLMKNKTVIAIAHRLSTLREMDRILVFDNGKIVEDGTHQSLLRKKGQYYKLYNMQADGFIQPNL